MKKIIAIPTQKGKLSKGISNNTLFNIFEMEDGKVVRFEQEKPDHVNSNYASLWMSWKRITELYIDEIADDLKEMLVRLGIIVKQKDELSDNDFFNRFVFD